MRITLKDFQTVRADELTTELELARGEAARGRLQAVTLASPTGSGKTVIATAVIEQLFEGDDEHQRDPDASILWITDQPELNEQTKNKMLATSSVLSPSRLRVIDASFDQETFDSGKVYFLNTQKLGRNSGLIRTTEDRRYTLWETISNTVAVRPSHFYVVIDEAHRGMQGGQAREEANTIIQKFIVGSDGEIPAVPLIVGVSATLGRFDAFVSGTPRVRRPIEVSIEEVRDSGLVKDIVRLHHPDESQPSDVTMLRAAARDRKEYEQRWTAYGERQDESIQRPVLLVQVQDGTDNQISRTDLQEALSALSEELGHPPAEWFANAFQEGVPVTVGSTTVRYLAPSAIDPDPDVRVIFFKTSLTTGWDCPRAEVMMSFRTARDVTSIAQLVGRMVRAPLARRVEDDEHLNTVSLFLPHYDRRGLARVVARLRAGDPNEIPPTDIREATEVATLARAAGSEALFTRLSALPSYVVPKRSHDTQVRRLGKLGSLLSSTGIANDASDSVRALLVECLLAECERLKETDGFKSVVKESGLLDVRVVEWRYDAQATPDAAVQIEISDENVNDLSSWAGKRLGEGIHSAYWKRRADDGETRHRLTKLEAYALAANRDVYEGLQTRARHTVAELFERHDAEINGLPEGPRQAFTDLRQLAGEPVRVPLVYAEAIDVVVAEESWSKHLYVESDGSCAVKLNTWEAATVRAEVERDDVVAWLRNADRKPWSLCIPYSRGGEVRGCYPDFLVLRRTEGGIVVDILDPHLLSFDDAWQRAQGIARYIAKHADSFGRVELIQLGQDGLERLDLKDEAIRQRVLGVTTNQHLRDLFALTRPGQNA